MKLVANWNQSWKWVSMQCTAAVTALNMTWVATPVDLKTHKLDLAVQGLTVVLGFAAMFGRLIQQQPVSYGAQDAQEAIASLKDAQKQIAPIAAGQADLTVESKP